MLGNESDQEFFGFSQGWRPRLVDGNAPEEGSAATRGSVLEGEEATAGDAAVADSMEAVCGDATGCDAADSSEAQGETSVYELDDSAYAVDSSVELPWEEQGDDDAAQEWDSLHGACGEESAAFAQESALQPAADIAQTQQPLAPLIAVVGGSGGVGRSTLAFLMASLCAQQGIDTVLLEGDLQFGDYGFWLGLDDEADNLAKPSAAAPISCPQGFDLYRAPVFPEVADKVCDELAQNLCKIREGRGIVIADTGAYWSGFTASLLLQCDVFVMMSDSRPASTAAAIKASELCGRLGVPSTRMVAVCNRWNSRCALSTQDIARALGVDKTYCIPDGREVVEELVRCGDFNELAQSGNPVIAATSMLLKAVLPRVGISCSLESFRKKGFFK